MQIKNIVNLKDYPIDRTESKEYQDLITKNRELLDKDGCCVLRNFVLSESLKRMKEEVERNLPKTHWTKDHHNPCLLYTSPSPRDGLLSRMPSSA